MRLRRRKLPQNSTRLVFSCLAAQINQQDERIISSTRRDPGAKRTSDGQRCREDARNGCDSNEGESRRTREVGQLGDVGADHVQQAASARHMQAQADR